MEKEFLFRIFSDSLEKIGVTSFEKLNFESPKNPDHGDLSCNIAMQLAKDLKKSPRDIAQSIIDNLDYDPDAVSEVSIAGPGFINIRFSPAFYTVLFEKVRLAGKDYGRSIIGKGLKVNVEYVSANPTGLLHLGHGRNAVIGDTVANLYEWCGYDVTREYYFNNAGNQMNNLGKSIYSRYMQMVDESFAFPDDGYHGEYVKEIAAEIRKKHGSEYEDGSFQDMADIRKYGESWCFEKIRETLNNLNIKQDVFYNEDSLYKEGKIKELLDELKEKGLSYEKDDATWLKLSEMGLDDDRVIVKSSGEPTYRLPDIAYHKEKFKRGFDIIVDVFGADHIATIPDVMAALKYLGFDQDRIKVLIHQFVTLTRDGQQVKMSKRTGKSYTLDDLIAETGKDVTRFFLLMRNFTTHLEFDLGLAQEQSDKNPVFYLQYAHARICSVFENADDKGIALINKCNYKLLTHDSEIKLIKEILRFPDLVEAACRKHETHSIAEYLREMAAAYHRFYHDCIILNDDDELTLARLHLADVSRNVIKNGLSILGISAPQKM